jgi:ATP synthase subunit 6
MFQPLEQFEIDLNYFVFTFPSIRRLVLTYIYAGECNPMILGFSKSFTKIFTFDDIITVFVTTVSFYSLFFLCILFSLFSVFIVWNYEMAKKNILGLLLRRTYGFLNGMTKNQISKSRKVQKFLPFLLFLFFYILLCNFMGLVPFNFTLTSHLIVTLSLSSMVFFSIISIGIFKNRERFLLLFVPTNVPLFLLDFLFIIEFVSYFSRLFSLSIRLFANMLAGHALLYILSTFVVKSVFNYNVFFSLRFIILLVIFLVGILELGICFLQAYVFLILSVIYLNEIFKIGNGH